MEPPPFIKSYIFPQPGFSRNTKGSGFFKGIQNTGQMGYDRTGDLTAFDITTVECFLDSDGTYSYKAFAGIQIDKKLRGLPESSLEIFEDIVVERVPDGREAFEKIAAQVRIEKAKMECALKYLDDNGKWASTEDLLKAFDAASYIYRQWPSVRRIYDGEAELIQLRDNCMRVLSKIVACRYANLPEILERNPPPYNSCEDMASILKRDPPIAPASIVYDRDSLMRFYPDLKRFFEKNLLVLDFKGSLVLFHDHGITERQYFSAKRKLDNFEKFPVKPVLQNH